VCAAGFHGLDIQVPTVMLKSTPTHSKCFVPLCCKHLQQVENGKSKVILNIDADINWAFPKYVLSCKKKPAPPIRKTTRIIITPCLTLQHEFKLYNFPSLQ
jgi:hypothetical protein